MEAGEAGASQRAPNRVSGRPGYDDLVDDRTVVSLAAWAARSRISAGGGALPVRLSRGYGAGAKFVPGRAAVPDHLLPDLSLAHGGRCQGRGRWRSRAAVPCCRRGCALAGEPRARRPGAARNPAGARRRDRRHALSREARASTRMRHSRSPGPATSSATRSWTRPASGGVRRALRASAPGGRALVMLESARQQWDEGKRRLETVGAETALVAVISGCWSRRSSRSSGAASARFTLAELAGAYDGSEDWVRDIVRRTAPPRARAGIRDVAPVQDAAFAHYARGASDTSVSAGGPRSYRARGRNRQRRSSAGRRILGWIVRLAVIAIVPRRRASGWQALGAHRNPGGSQTIVRRWSPSRSSLASARSR